MKHPIPREAFDDRLGFLGTSGSGKTYNSGTAVEILLSSKARVVIIDPLGVWWGLRLLADGKTPSRWPVAIFGGAHGDLPLTENGGALIGETAATMAESCIIDLSELKTRSAERRFMLAFLEAIYRTAKTEREPFHLIVDEADLFAPQKPADGDQALLGMMENIIRRGRVFGFIPWLISQRPAVLNKNVLSMVDGLLAFKLTSPQDRDALDGWIEGQADKATGKEIKDRLPTLQLGEGVVWLPGHGLLECPAKFPAKVTFDSSRTPKRGEKVKARKLKPLDIGGLKERLATIEAEAKANDPKALRSEIAMLKAESDKLANAKNIADPEAMRQATDAAYAKGYGRGKIDGYGEGITGAAGEFAGVLKLLDDVEGPLKDLRASALRVQQWAKREAKNPPKNTQTPTGSPTVSESGIINRAPAPRRESAPLRVARPSAVASGDGVFNRPQMRVLESLAMWLALGHATPSREMVAAVAGYAPSSGGYNNLVGGLVTAGAVDKPGPGMLSLRASGIGAMSREEGRDMLLNRLSAPHRKLIAVMNGAGDMTREQLAEATQYSAGSGGFNNLVGALGTLGIIVKPRHGSVMLSDWAQELLNGYAIKDAA